MVEKLKLTYIITSECVKCGICIDACPTSAIIEGEDQYIITETCISCGKCLENCPIEAIKLINRTNSKTAE